MARTNSNDNAASNGEDDTKATADEAQAERDRLRAQGYSGLAQDEVEPKGTVSDDGTWRPG